MAGKPVTQTHKAPKELSCPLMAILRNTTAEKPTLQPGAPVSQGDRKPPPSFASGFSSYKRGVSDVSTGQLTPVCLHGSWACCLEGKRCLRAIPSVLPSGTSSKLGMKVNETFPNHSQTATGGGTKRNCQ